MELLTKNISELRTAIDKEAIPVLSVAENFLAHIKKSNERTHAFCTLNDEYVLEQARALDLKRKKGGSLGPLFGVPIAIKDILYTKNLTTTFGSALYKDFVPDQDDIVVERLKAADAIIIGKTNTTEFGYSAASYNKIFPPTRNPWNTELTSGGSSAGSAVAVADYLSPGAMGSDGGGSIRVPAAFCGIYGFKPSAGIVPTYPTNRVTSPGISGWESLQVLGPLTRSVKDAALLMSVLAGPDARDRLSVPKLPVDWLATASHFMKGKRIGFSLDLGYLEIEPEIKAIVHTAIEAFAKASKATLKEIKETWEYSGVTFSKLIALDADITGLKTQIKEKGCEITPYLEGTLGTHVSADKCSRALMQRKTLYNRMQALMKEYDFIMTPVTAINPFPAEGGEPEMINGKKVRGNDWFGFCYPVNMTGQPAASLPAGITKAGLPVGLQIIGNHLCDYDVLLASYAYEAALPWEDRLKRKNG